MALCNWCRIFGPESDCRNCRGRDILPLAVIFDRDGTLASVHNGPGHRAPDSDWAAYNAALPFDRPVPIVVGLLRAIRPDVVRIMVSGRAEGDWPGDRRRRFAMQDWIAKHDIQLGSAVSHERGCRYYVHEKVYEVQTRKALEQLLPGQENQGRIEELLQTLYGRGQSSSYGDQKTSVHESEEREEGFRPRTLEEIQTESKEFQTQTQIQHNFRRIRGDVGEAERTLCDLQTTGETETWSSSSGSLPLDEQSERSSLFRLQCQPGEIRTSLGCGCKIPPYNVNNYLFMRCGGDGRLDSVVKEEILLNDILPRFNPVLAVDDRPQVLDVWRRHGIATIAVVNPGDLPIIGEGFT